ncbi:Sil1 nucleotide exchange factor [Carabus blaptoides fortunei]
MANYTRRSGHPEGFTHKSEDDRKSSALSEVKQSVEETKEETAYSPDELKHILQNIKSDDIISVPTDETQGILEKFRSYEQLKVELGDMNMSVKSDIEILRELFVKFKQTSANTTLLHEDKESQIVYILEDFEYLVHQIDNANEFVSLDGFNVVIYHNLNSTNVRVKCESLSVLAACVQNNGKAQIHALESGAVDKVIKILALDANIDVKLRAVYALSSLLRRFPLAQKYFIKNGGLNVFTSVFSKSENIKLQVKIVTLIYDLLMEHQDAVHGHADNVERLRQYREVDLKAKLIELGWCKTFNGLLVTSVLVEANDHDTVERCLHVMTLVSDGCLATFNNDRLRTVLGELYQNYTQLSIAEGTTDSYYNSLKELTHSLLKHINSYRKTEL